MTSSTKPELIYTEGKLEEYKDFVFPMFKEHFDEVGFAGGPETLSFNLAQYLYLESIGAYVNFGVGYDHKEPLGYVGFLLHRHPHHCQHLFAESTGIYVHPDHRKGWIGVRLIKYAEKTLKQKYNVEYCQLHTNPNKDLSALSKRLGYVTSDTIVTKKL